MDGHRGPHESSSALGQAIHDQLGGRGLRIHDAVDDDGIRDSLDIRASSTKIFRRIEHKEPGSGLSDAQWRMYPLYAEAIGCLATRGRVEPQQSGVFVVECAIPEADANGLRPLPAEALVRKLFWDRTCGGSWILSAHDLQLFLTARPVDFTRLEIAA